jgi:hypothetical protein
MQGCCTLHVHSSHTPWRCHRSPVKQCGSVWCLLGCRSHFLPTLECCTVPNDYLTSHGGVITSQQRICVWVLRCALICPTLLSGWWDLAWPALWLSRSVRSVLFDLLLRVVLMWSAICCCGLLRFALLCFLFVAICLFWVLVVAICLESGLDAMYIKVMHGIGRNQCEALRYQVDRGNADQCKSIQHKGMHSNAMVAREVS